jgi:hypothetical protein
VKPDSGFVEEALMLLVIPAEAGIQRLVSPLKTLDSSFRWNDEQKAG